MGYCRLELGAASSNVESRVDLLTFEVVGAGDDAPVKVRLEGRGAVGGDQGKDELPIAALLRHDAVEGKACRGGGRGNGERCPARPYDQAADGMMRALCIAGQCGVVGAGCRAPSPRAGLLVCGRNGPNGYSDRLRFGDGCVPIIIRGQPDPSPRASCLSGS